jgi:putative acetyltransferase
VTNEPVIRDEQGRDAAAIRALHEQAFGGDGEAGLVEALRRANAVVMSLVAVVDGDVVGHVLFSPVVVESGNQARVVALAPMAVAPAVQRRGIGSRLVREGLNRCRTAGIGAVVVLGHARYYPRFGFAPASRFGLRCEYEVPDEVFMAIDLRDRALDAVSGLVRYHPAFAGL